MNEQIKKIAERAFNSATQIEGSGGFESWWQNELNMNGELAGILSRSGGVWVKASERLPETDGMVFIRNVMTKHGGMIHTNELAKMENLFNVEWLSESPAADKGDAIDGWMSLDEYEKIVQEQLKEKPVIKLLNSAGLKFKDWKDNIHGLVDKEMNAIREVRIKIKSKQTKK